MVRLLWVLHRGVSLAGDCIFNKHYCVCSGLWYDYTGSYTVVFSLLVTVSLKSLCSGLWYDSAGSNTVVFPVLVTVSLKKISVFWTVIRLHWVLYRGVSRAGDCIFKKSLSSGLWHDYAGSYSVVFPLLVTVSLKNPSVLDCGTTTAWCFPCW